MNRFLKSTTAIVMATSLAMPHFAMAQSGEADPQMERTEQAQQAEIEKQRLEAEAAAAKAAAKAERKAEKKAERKEEKKAERKQDRKDAQAAIDAQAQADAKAQAEAKAAATAEADAQARAAAKAEADAKAKVDAQATATDLSKAQIKAERRAERKAERVADRDAAKRLDSQEQADLAAQNAQETKSEAATQTTGGKKTKRQIKRGDVRTSGQEYSTTANAVQTDNDNGISDLGKLAILGLGAFAVSQYLKRDEQIVTNSGDRMVVQGDNGLRILKDDDALLYRPGSDVETETFNDGSTRTFVTYSDGSQVVTIRAADGRVLRRSRIMPNGQEVMLFDDTRDVQPVQVSQLPTYRSDGVYYNETVSQSDLRTAMQATQMSQVDRRFSLSQIRNIDAVRRLVPEISVDNVQFASGSSVITPDQAQELAALGGAMRDAIRENPGDVFLIEGHTDAVGTAGFNLALSDRRAETVALALSEYFEVPSENLVVQGYGESDLKVLTTAAEPANRRVSVRRITPLLN